MLHLWERRRGITRYFGFIVLTKEPTLQTSALEILHGGQFKLNTKLHSFWKTISNVTDYCETFALSHIFFNCYIIKWSNNIFRPHHCISTAIFNFDSSLFPGASRFYLWTRNERDVDSGRELIFDPRGPSKLLSSVMRDRGESLGGMGLRLMNDERCFHIFTIRERIWWS